MKQELNQVGPTYLENSWHHNAFKFSVNQDITFPVKNTWQFIMQAVLGSGHTLVFCTVVNEQQYLNHAEFLFSFKKKKDAYAKIPTFRFAC